MKIPSTRSSIVGLLPDRATRLAWASLIASFISFSCSAAYMRHASVAMQNVQDPSVSYHVRLAGDFGVAAMIGVIAAFGLICCGYSLRHRSVGVWELGLLALVAAITAGFASLILV